MEIPQDELERLLYSEESVGEGAESQVAGDERDDGDVSMAV